MAEEGSSYGDQDWFEKRNKIEQTFFTNLSKMLNKSFFNDLINDSMNDLMQKCEILKDVLALNESIKDVIKLLPHYNFQISSYNLCVKGSIIKNIKYVVMCIIRYLATKKMPDIILAVIKFINNF